MMEKDKSLEERHLIKSISNDFFISDIIAKKISPAITSSYNKVKKSEGIENSYEYEYGKELITYKVNNYDHRSSDFNVLDKEDFNVLFAGCSVTFGEALPEGYSWDNHLYKKIKDEGFKVGPFQSLSYPGKGADFIINNIINYCDHFGSPNIVYVLLPDYARMLSWDSQSRNFETVFGTSSTEESLIGNQDMHNFLLSFVNSIRALEYYCESKNIKLFLTSWDVPTTSLLIKIGIDSFVPIYDMSIESPQPIYHINDLKDLDKYSGHKFLFDAADKNHFGLFSHLIFTESIFKKSKDLGMI